jgi:hypothetical protein
VCERERERERERESERVRKVGVVCWKMGELVERIKGMCVCEGVCGWVCLRPTGNPQCLLYRANALEFYRLL